MIDRSQIEAHIQDHLVKMEEWTYGTQSSTNSMMFAHPEPERRHEVLAAIEQADAAQVMKHSACVQAYAALLLAVPTEIPAKISHVHEEDLRMQLYTLPIRLLRDRIVQINHDQGTCFEVNYHGYAELITFILDRLSLQEIIDFIEEQK